MPETTREKLSAFLNIIGRYMTEYSAKLELEHHESQLRLDIRNLTVVADTLGWSGTALSYGERRELGWLLCTGVRHCEAIWTDLIATPINETRPVANESQPDRVC